MKLTIGTYRYSSRSSLISQQCKHPSHLHIRISNSHHQSIQMTKTNQHWETLGPHLEDKIQMLDTTAPSLGMCLTLKEAVILTQVPKLLKKCRKKQDISAWDGQETYVSTQSVWSCQHSALRKAQAMGRTSQFYFKNTQHRDTKRLFSFWDVIPTPHIFKVGESIPSFLRGAANFCFLVY